MLGLIYTIGKDLIKYISYKEEDKLVDSDWLKKSGFGEEQRQIGNDLRWTVPEKVETRKVDGWKIVYEIDKIKRVKRTIIKKDKSILMCKEKY